MLLAGRRLDAARLTARAARRVMTEELHEQAERSGQAAACSSGAVARAEAARAADAVQVRPLRCCPSWAG